MGAFFRRTFRPVGLTKRQRTIRIGIVLLIVILIALSPEIAGMDVTWAVLIEPELLLVLIPLLIAMAVEKSRELGLHVQMNYASITSRWKRG